MSRPARKSAPAKKATATRKPAAKKAPAKPFQIKPQHEVFAAEFCKDQCGKDAAIRAGYSSRNAEQQASRLLARPEIRALVDAGMARIREKVEEETAITLSDVVRKIGDLAMFDMRKLLKDDGTVLPTSEWPPDVAAAVAGFEVFEEYAGSGEDRILIGHTKKVKLIERTKALDMLMKHLGGYEKDNQQKANPLAEVLAMVWGKGSTLPIATQKAGA